MTSRPWTMIPERTPSVVLLVGTCSAGSFSAPLQEQNDLTSIAKQVCDILSNQYHVVNVTVRSAWVPIDRLTTVIPPLYVALASSKEMAVPPAVTWLVETSPAPVLRLETDVYSPLQIALTIAKHVSWATIPESPTRQAIDSQILRTQQAVLAQDAQLRTKSPRYHWCISATFDAQSQITGSRIVIEGCDESNRQVGKVRDRYTHVFSGKQMDYLTLITTDRQSGFDRHLALVPYKGAVLNLTSAYWFRNTSHIIPNHLVATPHPYVSVVHACTPFPIEFVVRYDQSP
jgi:SAICAR synthetase